VKTGLRLAALAVLLASGIALVVLLQRARLQPPLESTFTSAFQIVGAPLKLADRVASRVLPVGDVDEEELGDVYRASYDPQASPPSREQRYLDSLMKELQPFAGKPFPYRAYVVDYPHPNAMALPGGVLLVTRELLTTLHSESELVSVLAHEMGHVERGHCFDFVRFELTARKIGAEPLGVLADIAAQVLLGHSYSKTMEHEADEYSLELLTNSRYDPRGVAGAFRSMEAYAKAHGEETPRQASPIRDYFTSHPPLEIRAGEFGQRADVWWIRHPDERRYVGVRNLSALVSLPRHELADEWTGPKGPSNGSSAGEAVGFHEPPGADRVRLLGGGHRGHSLFSTLPAETENAPRLPLRRY
jgi:Zn-dependent protease with chaperone function